MTDIIKEGAQILSPKEYEAIREQLNPGHRLIFDGMLFTGMRIEEFWRFVKNPMWFHPDRQYVELPRGSILKVAAKQKERTVILSNIGTRAIRDLVSAIARGEVKVISKVGWNQDLKRAAAKAGVNPRGIMAKMARKTWVSWLMVIYPSDGLRISASSGHTIGIMQRHYLSLPFSTEEREQIKMYVVGWGGNV
jgi:integrase